MNMATGNIGPYAAVADTMGPRAPSAPAAMGPAAPSVAAPIVPEERGIEFHVDSRTGIAVISVVDRATGEIVRQIPEDVVLRIARYLDAELGGRGVINTSA